MFLQTQRKQQKGHLQKTKNEISEKKEKGKRNKTQTAQ